MEEIPADALSTNVPGLDRLLASGSWVYDGIEYRWHPAFDREDSRLPGILRDTTALSLGVTHNSWWVKRTW